MPQVASRCLLLKAVFVWRPYNLLDETTAIQQAIWALVGKAVTFSDFIVIFVI